MDDKMLFDFFEQHLLNYKNGLLSDEQKRRFSEYCLQEIFLEEIDSKKLSEKTILKYMTLGWYVYKMKDEEEKKDITEKQI